MGLVIPYFAPIGVGLLLVLNAIIFLMFGSEGGGDLAVKGGEFGFEGFQFVFFASRLGDDGFELGNIGFEFCGAFLILGDDAGNLLQCVDKVHASGMGVGHGDKTVVELVFVVAFDHKSVLD